MGSVAAGVVALQVASAGIFPSLCSAKIPVYARTYTHVLL